MLTDLALKWLRAAGYEVTPADGVPGLWDIHGLARDVTINQLFQLAMQHGQISPAERSVLAAVAAQTCGVSPRTQSTFISSTTDPAIIPQISNI